MFACPKYEYRMKFLPLKMFRICAWKNYALPIYCFTNTLMCVCVLSRRVNYTLRTLKLNVNSDSSFDSL